MDKLKPCPFCGGEAEMKIHEHIPRGFDYTPRCKDSSCCGRIMKKWNNEDTARYAWNLRKGE